jgi:AcrR family transcriptional regulator
VTSARPYASLRAKGDDRKVRILAAAQRLLTRNGWRNTTLAQIAKEAGVSAAGLLHHFESKEQLLHAVVDARDADDDAHADRAGDLLEQIARVGERVDRNPELVGTYSVLLVENLMPDAPLHDRMFNRQRAAVRIVAELIRRGQESGRYLRSGPQGSADCVPRQRNGNRMVARSLNPAAGSVARVREVAGTGVRSGGNIVRYRLDVVTPSVTEAVRSAGGWIFDRVMAGWDVRVLLHPDTAVDDRPLHILGAEIGDLESALHLGPNGLRPHALAVSADLYHRDERIRAGVQHALDSGQTEVTLWGESWPTELEHSSVGAVQHRLSVAARAFKAQALAALDCADVPAATVIETFRSGTPASCPVAADLVPAS